MKDLTKSRSAGKGDKPRPCNYLALAQNWDSINWGGSQKVNWSADKGRQDVTGVNGLALSNGFMVACKAASELIKKNEL